MPARGPRLPRPATLAAVRTLDLRSDTVTRPTPAMREAMARAEVGDDVYGEDPSVNRLQARAAELLGKPAALFVASGTMGNQASLRALSQPGDVLLAGEDAHILLYEAGAASALWGVQVNTIGRGGCFDGADVRAAIAPDEVHFAPTRILSIENTHNRSGGRVFPLDQLKDAAQVAKQHGLALHLDGARLWNAAVKQGVEPRAIAQHFDSVSVCLSKGLGAPVGSVLCGGRDFIKASRRWRKMLGGGMRQAGILAAAGRYAIAHHIPRLAEDHEHAARLAAGLVRHARLAVAPPQTNMVFVGVPDELAQAFGGHLAAEGVRPHGTTRQRWCTHLDVSRADVDAAIASVDRFFARGGAPGR